jgi:hypothetical protein
MMKKTEENLRKMREYNGACARSLARAGVAGMRVVTEMDGMRHRRGQAGPGQRQEEASATSCARQCRQGEEQHPDHRRRRRPCRQARAHQGTHLPVVLSPTSSDVSLSLSLSVRQAELAWPLPEAIEVQLVNDWEAVTRDQRVRLQPVVVCAPCPALTPWPPGHGGHGGQLVPVPKTPSVTSILDEFAAAELGCGPRLLLHLSCADAW